VKNQSLNDIYLEMNLISPENDTKKLWQPNRSVRFLSIEDDTPYVSDYA
jgi:hypothetical protein